MYPPYLLSIAGLILAIFVTIVSAINFYMQSDTVSLGFAIINVPCAIFWVMMIWRKFREGN